MASKWLQHGPSHHPPSSLLITHTKKSNSHGPATITSPPINSPIAFHHYRYEFLYRSVYFRSTPAHSQCCRRTLAELPMARTTKPRPFPRRMALRLLSAAVCLSLAAAGSREKEQRERDSTDSLAALVDREVDIVGVYNKLKLQAELTGEPPVFQGDILLSNRTVEYLSGLARHPMPSNREEEKGGSNDGVHLLQMVYHQWKERRKRASVRSEMFKWPNATVIYRFDDNYSERGRSVALQAMRHWQKRTCIKFELKKPHHKDYVTFMHHSIGCSSEVGRSGGEQMIFASHPCSTKLGSLIHELGHAIGFWHEHSRPDRDSYIRIQVSNIWPDKLENFHKLPPTQVDMLGTSYDYDSIMHYGPKAFTRNELPTLSVRDTSYRGTIGQRLKLSKTDARQANLLYGCVAPTPSTTGPPVLKSVVKKGDKIALQLVSSPENWMACNSYACNISSCPGKGFLHSSTQLACATSVFHIHSITSLGKPLVVGDHILLGDAQQRDVICKKSGKCALSGECRAVDGTFSISTCSTHTVRVRVQGKRTGEYVQHRDRFYLEYTSSKSQWLGCRNSPPPLDGCRRLYFGLDYQNSIKSYQHSPTARDEFILHKLAQ